MAEKKLPFSQAQLDEMLQKYPTPFHLYDEAAIRANVKRLLAAFSWAPDFKEYFAVKATPNPFLLKILKEEGLGADCSSAAELILAEKVGIIGENIMFSSNDTPAEEYAKAVELGAIINLDDISHIEYLEKHVGLPELLSFRYNPGSARAGNTIIGKPEDAKYGLTKEQLFEAYRIVRDKGVKRFGIHTMVISNELNPDYFIETARMMMTLVKEIYETLGIRIEMINFGGGIGVPYRPEDNQVDLEYVGAGIRKLYEEIIVPAGLAPLKLALECGRMIAGPYGYLVSKVLHKKETYKNYVGLDSCMANLMRPALYGSYHHITVVGKEQQPLDHVYDVTGSLCENNDKFAIDRALPQIDIGDIVVIHDAGAHGHAMGFNYNGKLRSAEILLKADGTTELIRRAETLEDYFATLDFSKL
ncbi:MAG: diaminopimelate decarboxylase [Anaeromusa sp.]|jgi:diaminopimelate decarboxylase|uniref:diaminopimelate decarboxylase family protein n=1 Tax=Anaeromusa sp. TaxID=1872520 RepID=UPI0026297441|nr:diaminopimelate decarboxylase [Anaeromusa sp.]MDD3157926.1 diaminopimelate decarboxylase [Anaeromusa sp.]MEA4834347.1 diaminopimelate decarboxylase [Anaeromusa sp.]NCB77423.1 diaminopimelate decarboxylase [Negativicutes bacterium]